MKPETEIGLGLGLGTNNGTGFDLYWRWQRLIFGSLRLASLRICLVLICVKDVRVSTD